MSRLQLLPQHRELIRQQIAELGLDEFGSEILKGAYTSFELFGEKQVSSRKKGTTRFGGHPDLPSTFDPSELDDFEFVYQVNLADLPKGHALGLPAGGLLSVFSDCEPYYGGKTLFFEPCELIRHRMPAPAADDIFSDVKPWKLRVGTKVAFPQYGDDLIFEIDGVGLEAAYEQLLETKFHDVRGPRLGEILGRFSDLNGDMRKTAVDRCGGKAVEWRSLWKVFSNYDSGLVISDFHQLHGMIRNRHLKSRRFEKVFSCTTNG